MQSLSEKIEKLRKRIKEADYAFDMAVAYHEAWKPAASNEEVHKRMGTSYATQTFFVIRQALGREMAMTLAKLWDKDGRSIGLFCIAKFLEEEKIVDELAQKYHDTWSQPNAQLVQEYPIEERATILELLDAETANKADEKVTEFRIEIEECVKKIGQYGCGGTKENKLKNLKTLRNKKLAHQEFDLNNKAVAKIDAAAQEVDEIFDDTLDIIMRLKSCVCFTHYDPSETAAIYRKNSELFWAGVRGERTEGHPSYKRSV